MNDDEKTARDIAIEALARQVEALRVELANERSTGVAIGYARVLVEAGALEALRERERIGHRLIGPESGPAITRIVDAVMARLVTR